MPADSDCGTPIFLRRHVIGYLPLHYGVSIARFDPSSGAKPSKSVVISIQSPTVVHTAPKTLANHSAVTKVIKVAHVIIAAYTKAIKYAAFLI